MRIATNSRRLLLVVAAVLTASCKKRPTEYGVSVFSTDTIPVTFTLTLTGSLALGMRSEGFQMQPDKSLVLTTPAELVVSGGDGSARIASTKGQRLAIQPLGISAATPADTVTVVAPVVMLVKPPEKRTVKLSAEKQ